MDELRKSIAAMLGSGGGKAAARNMTAEQRTARARKAGLARAKKAKATAKAAAKTKGGKR